MRASPSSSSNSLKVAHVDHVLRGGPRDALPLLLFFELLLRVKVRTAHPWVSAAVLLKFLVLMLLVTTPHWQVLQRIVAWKASLIGTAGSATVFWDGESERIHSVFESLRARICEAVVIRDGLEHV